MSYFILSAALIPNIYHSNGHLTSRARDPHKTHVRPFVKFPLFILKLTKLESVENRHKILKL
jgi:hypothetical protein